MVPQPPIASVAYKTQNLMQTRSACAKNGGRETDVRSTEEDVMRYVPTVMGQVRQIVFTVWKMPLEMREVSANVLMDGLEMIVTRLSTSVQKTASTASV